MKYGHFDDKNKEYIITNPRTPVKWINYIGSLAFGGYVDQTGNALLCCKDPSLNRITRYITILPNSEMKGTTLYIRLHKEDGSFMFFSPFFVPTLDEYDLYECHIGLQYTKIISEFYSIRSEITIFIPNNKNVEIRDINITNLSSKARSINIIPVVEYSHFDALKQLTNADWVPQTMQCRAAKDPDNNYIITQSAFMKKDKAINYFTANKTISSFETDRKKFLGNNEYCSWKDPMSLYNENFSNTEVNRGDNITALMIPLGIIEPGKTEQVITQLGQTDKIENVLADIKYFKNPQNIQKSLNKIKKFWNDNLSVLNIETPDNPMNSMVNIHNPKQCYITMSWSRYLSLYQLGYGSRGIGFRDSCQDLLGIIPQKPVNVKKLLIKILHNQKKNGSAMHQFNPLSMEATEGDAREKKDRPQYYSDDHLWAVIAVCKYIKETGDFYFLDKKIPFYKSEKDDSPIVKDIILNHLKKAIEFTENNKGNHNLPLLGFADWNDTYNLPVGAESIFTANLYGYALKEMIELLENSEKKDSKEIEKYKKYYDNMKEAVNSNSWDGEWYIRYFDHQGNPVGSKDNDKGKIFVNAQSWSIISGFAENEKARIALESVYNFLNTEYGIKIMAPSYNGYDEIKGGITTYPTGTKENGGIFLHTNPWVIIAETIIGNGNRAFKYYTQMNPAAKNNIIEIYECEPYCYAQNILSSEHPQFGLARNSWLTGTASWAYQAATEYILGISSTYKGLKIDPCIPTSWHEFKIIRKFRGKTYNIIVSNPDNISKGNIQLKINKRIIDGNVIPLNMSEDIINVHAKMLK